MGQSVMAEDGDMPMEKPETKDEGYASGFVPKEFFGGRNVKPGDSETVTIKAVDPDSGEVEIMCESSGKGEETESEGALAGMDKQFPPEDEGD